MGQLGTTRIPSLNVHGEHAPFIKPHSEPRKNRASSRVHSRRKRHHLFSARCSPLLRRNGDAGTDGGACRGAAGGRVPARGGGVGADAGRAAGVRVQAGGVRGVHQRDGRGDAAGDLLRPAQGRRQERAAVPLRDLRLAGDLQGLAHQPHRRAPPLQALRHQRGRQQLPQQLSNDVSSRFSVNWQERWSPHCLGQFRGVDEPVPGSVVCIGIRILHARYAFSPYPMVDDWQL